MDRFALPEPLCERVLDALGVAAPTDLDRLGALYRAWLAEVPFTNLVKAEAAITGRASTEGDGAALCERWLADGTGGTCWSHVAAFAGLCAHGGLEVTASLERALWRIHPEVDFHGAVVVHVEDKRWLCDLVHATGSPLAVAAGAEAHHGPYGAGLVGGDDGVLQHWFSHPAREEVVAYRVLSLDMGPDDVMALVRVAEHVTGVPVDRLTWRRCPAGEVVSVRTPHVEDLSTDDQPPDQQPPDQQPPDQQPPDQQPPDDQPPDEPRHGQLELRRWDRSGLVDQRTGPAEEIFAAAGARDPRATARWAKIVSDATRRQEGPAGA